MSPRDLGPLRDAITPALREGLRALDPARLVARALPRRPPRGARIELVAIGKAAVPMARGALRRWGERVSGALVVTTAGAVDLPRRVHVVVAAHPIPDARSVAAAEEALARAGRLGEGDLLLALVSGGASSLAAAPPEGMTLAAKQRLVATLLERGAPIQDVNLVRRHLSRIKGGRLAATTHGARVWTLVLSDVIGGALHDVGSGPTVADPTSLRDARAALARWAPELLPEMDAYLSDAPQHSRERDRAEVLTGPAQLAATIASRLGARTGLVVRVDPPDREDLEATVRRRLARAATLLPGEALVVACEPTVALPAERGHGGRAGRVALAAMSALPPDVVLLCAASDGVDGSSGNAGAVVTASDAARAGAGRIAEHLAAFDDGPLHRALGTALPGGPTGHNLADVHILARAPRTGRLARRGAAHSGIVPPALVSPIASRTETASAQLLA
jgi:hydroxypyruvate reductase